MNDLSIGDDFWQCSLSSLPVPTMLSIRITMMFLSKDHLLSNLDVFLFQEERQDRDKLIPKAPKSMMQAKLTSLYGNSIGKPDNQRKTSVNNQDRASDECIIVERSHGFGFGTKRTHAETSSLANDGEVKADGAPSGFVSAKIKLVDLSMTITSLRVILTLQSLIFRTVLYYPLLMLTTISLALGNGCKKKTRINRVTKFMSFSTE